jgi:phosphate starvation-inducible PhoH-like protein
LADTFFVAKDVNSGKDFYRLEIDDDIDREELFGSMDANLAKLNELTGVKIIQRDDGLLLFGGDESSRKQTADLLRELMALIKKGEKLDGQKVDYVMSLKNEGVSLSEEDMSKGTICFTTRGKPIRAKTIGQKKYVECMKKDDVVFAIGPAGTGKTYIAVAMAVTALKNKQVQKIVLEKKGVALEPEVRILGEDAPVNLI